jgi:hypothetical protein
MKAKTPRRFAISLDKAVQAAVSVHGGQPTAETQTDPIFAAIDARKTVSAAWKADNSDDDDRNDEFCLRDAEAVRAMLGTPPTSLEGLKALMRYVLECEQHGDNILQTAMVEESKPFIDWDGPTPLVGGAALLCTIVTALDRLPRQ